MFKAEIKFDNGTAKVMEFPERHPAKSCAGWYFNQEGTQSVLVTDQETGEIKLSLDKNTDVRISVH